MAKRRPRLLCRKPRSRRIGQIGFFTHLMLISWFVHKFSMSLRVEQSNLIKEGDRHVPTLSELAMKEYYVILFRNELMIRENCILSAASLLPVTVAMSR